MVRVQDGGRGTASRPQHCPHLGSIGYSCTPLTVTVWWPATVIRRDGLLFPCLRNRRPSMQPVVGHGVVQLGKETSFGSDLVCLDFYYDRGHRG